MSSLSLVARWFWRGLRRGDWIWLWIAVFIASSSVALVTQLAASVHLSMLEKSASSLNADLVLRSSRPFEQIQHNQAWLSQQSKLQTSPAISLASMAQIGAAEDFNFQMVQLRALADNFPLKGELLTQNNRQIADLKAHQILVSDQLQALHNLQIGDQIQLGSQSFEIADFLLNQDVFQSAIGQFAPQVVLRYEQLANLNLLGAGSRANYEIMLSGAPRSIAQAQNFLQQQANPSWQIISAQAPNQELAQNLDTAWLFLDLTSLASLIIAGLAILIASNFYLQNWTNSIALMRALGSSNQQISKIFAAQLTYLATFASLLGGLAGIAIFYLLTPILSNYFEPLIIANNWRSLLFALLSGVLTLWAFAWPAFYRAIKTLPLQVLRSANLPALNPIKLYLPVIVLIPGLVALLVAPNIWLFALLGLALASLILLALAQLLLLLIAKIQPATSGWLRLALAAINRQPGLVRMQIIALGLVMFVLISISFIQQDLLQNWQSSLPKNTPNTFVISIQPDQKTEFNQLLTANNLTAELIAMQRGRLVAHNQQQLDPLKHDGRAKRLLDREANIAILDKIPEHNQIVKQLNSTTRPGDLAKLPSVSVEAGIAEVFKIQLGDRLTFDFIGEQQEYLVTSIRAVEWQSFRLNFFFILEPTPENLRGISYITNFYADLTNQQLAQIKRQINADFAGVIWLDAKQIIEQIQQIMQQASLAISWLYSLSLLASLIVIFSAIKASQAQRIQSWILLKTLGANRQTLHKISLTEFGLIGLLAGLVAATLAQITNWLLAVYLLDLTPTLSWQIWLSAIFASCGILLLIGYLTQRNILNLSVKQLSRIRA